MRRHGWPLVVLLAGAAGPAAVSAQPAHAQATRAYLGASLGGMVTTNRVDAPVDLALYGESARLRTGASWPAGPSLEVDGGVRVWRNLGVAVTVTRSHRDGESSVSGTVPHPFFFEQPRALAAAGPSLSRTETALHGGLAWTHAVSRRLGVAAIAGPSVIGVDQDVIAAIALRETYPYSSVQVGTATVARRSGSALGVHVAGDVVWGLTRDLGLSGGARYSHATVRIETTPGQRIDLDLGGVVIRVGLRWRF